MENHWIEDWLSARAESENTKLKYQWAMDLFDKFCQSRGKSLSSAVEEWRATHYQGAREEQVFLDQWNDLISGFATEMKPKYAPLSLKDPLTALKSDSHEFGTSEFLCVVLAYTILIMPPEI
jgi:hypothetical protein